MDDLDLSNSPKDVVLVIGDTHAARAALLEAASGQKTSFSASHVPSLISAKLNISTKYYSAEVQLMSLLESHDSPNFSEKLVLLHRSHIEALSRRVDSIIVLHKAEEDANNQSKLEQLLEELVEAWEPSVLLYVAETEDLIKESTSSWCLDNGFEIIGLKQDDEDRQDEDERFKEKVGHARILEALENNMWGHMTYKTSLRPQEAEEQKEKEEDNLDDIPPEVLSTFGDIMKFMRGTEQVSSSSGISKEADVLDETDAAFSEASMDRLLQAMAPISQLKSQLAGLPDDQRRKMAAQVAMAMMNMFGDDEDEEMF